MSKPNNLYLEICGGCNNNCISCPTPWNNEILSFEEIKDFIDTNAGEGSTIAITGGEPTTHPDFIRIMEYAGNSGRKVNLLTNGRKFCDYEFAESALKSGVGTIYIALHGPDPEIHNRITRSPGSFEETTTGIKNLFILTALGYPGNIVLKLLVSRMNIKYFMDSVRFINDNFPRPECLFVEITDIIYKALNSKDDLLITFTEAAPHIDKGVKFGLAHGQNIILLDIPPCVFPDPRFYYRLLLPLIKETRSIYGPMRHPQNMGLKKMTVKSGLCPGCEADKFCAGVWRSYGELAGLAELKPIRRLKLPVWIRGASRLM
ncbi:MAG: radical SAM protein [Planctomycetes bacterium]|nr:radical SAM protein [Planctomycetota bacterium]